MMAAPGFLTACVSRKSAAEVVACPLDAAFGSAGLPGVGVETSGSTGARASFVTEFPFARAGGGVWAGGSVVSGNVVLRVRAPLTGWCGLRGTGASASPTSRCVSTLTRWAWGVATLFDLSILKCPPHSLQKVDNEILGSTWMKPQCGHSTSTFLLRLSFVKRLSVTLWKVKD